MKGNQKALQQPSGKCGVGEHKQSGLRHACYTMKYCNSHSNYVLCMHVHVQLYMYLGACAPSISMVVG